MSDEEAGLKSDPTIRFHYIKGNQFRVIHADGAHGGVTPRGWIEMNFYSERGPIPQVTVHHLQADGTISGEILSERIQRDGLVREVDVGVILDLAAAESLQSWLATKITQLKELREDTKK